MASISGCGSSSPTAPAPAPAATPTPTPASIRVQTVAIDSARADPGWAVIYDVRVTESGGVGAVINNASAELYEAGEKGILLERRNSNALDDNRLEANATEVYRLIFGFLTTPRVGRYLLVKVSFTDDSGNTLEFSQLHRAGDTIPEDPW